MCQVWRVLSYFDTWFRTHTSSQISSSLCGAGSEFLQILWLKNASTVLCVCACACVDAYHCMCNYITCHCLFMSALATVPRVHRCLMALLMPVREPFSVNTHTVVGVGEKCGAMQPFVFNEGRAGRRTVDDAEGREAGCQSSPLPLRSIVIKPNKQRGECSWEGQLNKRQASPGLGRTDKQGEKKTKAPEWDSCKNKESLTLRRV